MKPSERRALEAEKRAQKEALEREKELEKRSARAESYSDHNSEPGYREKADSERINDDAEYQKIPKGDIDVKGDGYHRESFFGNHVKLITFIVSAVLVFTVIGPWGIDQLVAKSRAEIYGEEVENKIDLTVDGVITLADMGEDLLWETFANLNYTDYSFEKEGITTHIREYSVKGTNLVLRVGGTEKGTVREYKLSGTDVVIYRKVETSLPASPEYVRLIDYNTGEFVEDIRKDDVRAFIYAHTN